MKTPTSKNSEVSAESLVSLSTLAALLDADPSSIRRWLRDAGILPIVLGRGRNGAVRYHQKDVDAWLRSRQQAP